MHPNEAAINDYVDGTLDPSGRAAVERHLGECVACNRLAEDLREVRAVAASLDPREPPVRAWSRIERAVRLAQADAAHDRQRRRRLTRYAWLVAAAVLVLATSAGLRYGFTSGPRQGRGTVAPTASADAARMSQDDAARTVEAELNAAEEHYDKAIKGLEQVANAEPNALDPRTAATLQKNLSVIDVAISESRAAVRAQPTSEPARDSLMESFRAKIGLLQDTVALINEMRKGNETGAARIGSALKQKGT
jgi:anti-sigma factor RsiW